MRQDKAIRAFKNQMENYRYYVAQVEYYQMQIDDCFDKLGASPRSIDLSKIITHSPINKEIEHKIREDIEFYEKKKKYFKEQIDYIESVLNKMPSEQRAMAKEMFVLGGTELSVSDKHFISPSGMRHKINMAIKKALEDF